jgi:hypothetical protein
LVQEKTKEAARKEILHNELLELGIYVQDYDLFISKQIGDMLPVIKSLPRLSASDSQRISLAS